MTAETKPTDAKASQTVEIEKAGTDYVAFSHTIHDPWLETDVVVTARFRRPTQPMAARAQKTLLKKPDTAMQTLCLDVIHQEDRAAFVAHVQTYPGLVSTFGGELLKATGFGDLGN